MRLKALYAVRKAYQIQAQIGSMSEFERERRELVEAELKRIAGLDPS